MFHVEGFVGDITHLERKLADRSARLKARDRLTQTEVISKAKEDARSAAARYAALVSQVEDKERRHVRVPKTLLAKVEAARADMLAAVAAMEATFSA